MDSVIMSQISQVLTRIEVPIQMLDERGAVIYPEGGRWEESGAIPIDLLAENPGVPLVREGYTLIACDTPRLLCLSIAGEDVHARTCAVLAAALVRNIARQSSQHADRDESLRRILHEELDGAELESLAQEHGLPLDHIRCVLLLHLISPDVEFVRRTLIDVLPEGAQDVIVDVDRHTLVLVKDLESSLTFEELEQMCLAIQNTFISDTDCQVIIGLGEPRTHLSQLCESFREARRAIDVGRVYHSDERVFVFRKLLLERFLADVPREMGLKYSAMMFNRKTARLFNDEMVHTIEKFFENSLNLSETARQLYIHRNTLVYRLDKVQRQTGLDLRAFDDAVTFKMMMLLGKQPTGRHR